MGRWDDPNRKVPSIFLTHNEDIPKKEEKHNPLILTNKEKSFYKYIDDIPTYIHNSKEKFKTTTEELYKNIPHSIEGANYIDKIIKLQQKREDDILIQLFGDAKCDIMEEFVKKGFVLSDEKTQKIIEKINELKYKKKKEAWEEENNNLSPEEAMKKLEDIWNEYRNKISNIEDELNKLLKDLQINGTISSSFISTKKILDNWLKEYKWPKEMTIQEGMIEELRRTDGVIYNIYQTITEGYNKKNEAAIKTEIKSRGKNGYKFALLKEADEYRGEDEELKRLAKSDQIIMKLEGEVLIPIGGITVKKSSEGKPKVHDTTSVSAFLRYIMETDYIPKNEREQDVNRFTYLFGNRFVYGAKGSSVSQDLTFIIKKYGLIFFAGKIANEVLNKEPTVGMEFLKINDIFNKEHADFLYITTDKGGTIKRASDELNEIFKKGFTVNASILKEDEKSNILKGVSKIKDKYSPYNYSIITKNNSFKKEMDDFYNNNINTQTKIRLDSKKISIRGILVNG